MKENGQSLLVIAIILGLVVLGMYLVAQNGTDIFTLFWGFVEGLGQ